MNKLVFYIFLITFPLTASYEIVDSFTIRKACPTDISELQELLTETLRKTYKKIYNEQELQQKVSHLCSITELQKDIKEFQPYSLVAIVKGNIRGFVNASSPSLLNASIKHLYVHPSYQRQGIGTELLASVCNSFLQPTDVYCEVEKENTQAVSFFTKNGFSKEEEIKRMCPQLCHSFCFINFKKIIT